jgi:hypothetical protein
MVKALGSSLISSTSSGGTYWPKRPASWRLPRDSPGFDEKAPGHVEKKQRQDRQHAVGYRKHQVGVLPGEQVDADHEGQQQQRGGRRPQRTQRGKQHGHDRARYHQQQEFDALGVGGVFLDGVVEHPGNQVGVHFHTGVLRTHWRRADVENAFGGRADEHDPVLEHGGVRRASDDVGRRDVGKAAAPSPKRHQRLRLLVHRNPYSVQRQPLHFVAVATTGTGPGRKSQLDFLDGQRDANYRQRHGLIEIPAVLIQQGDPPNGAVTVRPVHQVTGRPRAVLKRVKIARVTRRHHEGNVTPREGVGRQGRCWQLARPGNLS